MNATVVLAVAVGGAAGSVARFAVSSLLGRWLGTGFPWGTVAVNITGCLIMGLLAGFAAQRWSLGLEARALIFTGVLGGFTTFSTFSLDIVTLVERGSWGAAVFYGTSSVALGILGLILGLSVARWILA
ncbi:fluoride efflux transporter CrcB [Novispirillum sp. DQ9]|uniref:fluoride efflux transporter CrcB n=1 Tax=Novispirillum sp. DQ9 TaxID=3398612 RepID=UPI003C7A2516